MAQSANVVTKDGWSSVSYGWTCSHCGLERLWFSSKQCRRCGAPKPSSAPSSPDAAAQVPRRNQKRGNRPTQKLSTPPQVSLAKAFDVFKHHERFKDSHVLAGSHSRGRRPIGVLGPPKSQGCNGEVARPDHRAESGSQEGKLGSRGGQAESRQAARGNRQATERVRRGAGSPHQTFGSGHTPAERA